MGVLASLEVVVEGLVDPSAEVLLLVESARALAVEIDAASVPDKDGKTRSAASAVRELRSVVDEMLVKGRRDADDDDWSSPVADLAKVRDAARPVPGDARVRGRRGGAAAG